MNLDGGTSSALYYQGKIITPPRRKLTNLLLVYDNTTNYEATQKKVKGALRGWVASRRILEKQVPILNVFYALQGATLRRQARLAAPCEEPDFKIEKVLFKLDDKVLGLAKEPPFLFLCDTTKIANGKHTLKVYLFKPKTKCLFITLLWK